MSMTQAATAKEIRKDIADNIAILQQDEKSIAERLVSNLSDDVLIDLTTAFKNNPTTTDIYKALGETLGPGAAGTDPEKAGRNAFNRIKSSTLRAICSNKAIQAYVKRASVIDATAMLSLVAGALSETAQYRGMNLVLVCCVVVRMGIYELCRSQWNQQKP